MYTLFIFYYSFNTNWKKCVTIVILVSCQKTCQSIVTQTEETNKENVPKQGEGGLKGEILQRAITGNFY